MLRSVTGGGGAAIDTLPARTTVNDAAVDTMAATINGQASQITMNNLLAALGSSAASLSSAGTLADADIMTVVQDGVNEVKVTLAVLKAYFGAGGGADTTAPTLTSPTGTQTGATTASGTVSTNEANGTLYRYASTNATETAATVKAAALTSTVTATGSQSVSFTGLTASTTYYAHYVHRDAAGNDSTVANSASFTTSASGYSIAGYSGNAVNASIDGTTPTSTQGSIKQLSTVKQFSDASGYFDISPTPPTDGTALAYAGWGTSSSTAPSVITQAANTAGSSSVNGMTPMNHPGAFQAMANLWVPVGSGATTWYFWVKPSDGAAQMKGSTTVTGA